MFKRWVCPLGIRLGATLHLAADSSALGAGTDLLLRYEDVWPTQISTRAVLETDEQSPRKSNERKLVREFQQLSPSQVPTPIKTVTPAEEIVQWLKDNGLDEGGYEIFTDGSWTDRTPWLQHMFHGSNPKENSASASIVCLHIGEARWTEPGLIIHIAPSDGLGLASGYPAELSALLCASQVAMLWKPAAIITDCESACNMIKKGFLPRAEQKRDHATLARLLVKYSRRLGPTIYRHTYAHLDNFLPSNLHTSDQRGNILADRAASTSEAAAQWITTQYPQLDRRVTTMQLVHEALIN
jgi:hypothetical protein